MDADPYLAPEPAAELGLTLGELRAIALVLALYRAHHYSDDAEVFAFVFERAKSKVKRALCDVGYGMPAHVLDGQAAEVARLDQWGAELHERGLL